MAVYIGSFGVLLLLIAFTLNLLNKLSERSPVYLLMNCVGAYMAAWYAYDGRNLPFLILEGVWGTTALIRLFARIHKGSQLS